MAAEAKYRITAVDNTKAAVASVKRGLGSLNSAAASLGAALGVGLSIGGLTALVKSSLDAADTTRDLAIRLGASTEALSQYRHVAKLSGVEFDSLAKSWQIMAKNLSNAAGGTGPAADALRDLGLSAASLAKLQPDQQFEALAGALSQVPGSADRVALAMELFGKSGAEMLQIVDAGTEGIAAMRKEADAMGLTLSRVDADKMAAANDAIDRVREAFGKVGRDLAIEFAPMIEKVATWLGDHLPFAAEYLAVAFLKVKAAILNTTEAVTKGIGISMAALGSFLMSAKQYGLAMEVLGKSTAAYSVAEMAAAEAEKAEAALSEKREALSSLIATYQKARAAVSDLGLTTSAVADDFSRESQKIKEATAALDAHVQAFEDWAYAKEQFEQGRGAQDSQVDAFEQFKEQGEAARDALESGFGMSVEDLLEYGAGWMTMGELVNQAGALAGEGMGNFIDATVAAVSGSRKAFSEFGKAMLKWASDTLKSMAVTAAAKALYYKAEALAYLSNPFTAHLAEGAMVAAGAFAKLAAATGLLAIGLGSVSAANAPSGSFMSQQERESTTGLAARDDGGYGGESSYSRGALTAANMTVTHIYNGPVYFGSQDLATAAGIQRVIDSGELYFQGSQ